jgi:fatty acid desaturase
VPDEQDEKDVHQSAVHEQCAREAEARVRLPSSTGPTWPDSTARPRPFRRSPASAIRTLSRLGIAAHRRFEGLRFDWRSAPGEDILPRAVRAHGAIIAAVLALWIAMTVAWGWAAGMAFGFVVAIALVRMAGVMLGGTLIQQAGRSYYERQLRGRRRAP